VNTGRGELVASSSTSGRGDDLAQLFHRQRLTLVVRAATLLVRRDTDRRRYVPSARLLLLLLIYSPRRSGSDVAFLKTSHAEFTKWRHPETAN